MDSDKNIQLQLAFDFVQYTNKNIFLTGKAGTGKTTFLHNLKTMLPKRMVVVAPTGVAAINAGGVTIHSFFQMPFGPYIPVERGSVSAGSDNNPSQHSFQRFNKEKINIIKSLDLLVIDEISMVRADLLDGIDDVLRRFKDRNKPFGGVQLLMIGDLQQLAPVVKDDEWNILKEYYDTIFFFSSRALRKTQHVSIELKHIYRQSDEIFIGILNKVRDNIIDNSTLDELNKRHIPGFAQNAEEGYITLTTHNSQAQELNESKLKKLKSEPFTFTAAVSGDFPEYSYPTEFKLTLKEGAQVMFVKNDISREKLYYNGKIGTVTSIGDDTIFVKCESDYAEIPVQKAEWQNAKYTIDQETKEIKETVAGTFMQYPLKLAWAITIHKSQGLTFERAIIDANAAFAHGQVYVALSRCKTLEGLVLSSPISQRSIKSDSTVSRFVRDVEENQPGDKLLTESKFQYQQELLKDLFDFGQIQRRLNYLIKTLNDNRASLHLSFIDVFTRMNASMAAEISTISEKFDIQIRQLVAQQGNLEENEALQERIKKACEYFSDKMETLVCNEIGKVELETDNKAVRKAVKDILDRLREEAAIKLLCLKECKNGFVVKKYLQVKAKAAIEKPSPKVARKAPDEAVELQKSNRRLYTWLKAWRDDMADEHGVPIYMILPQKTLMELANAMPVTKAKLAKIKGFGSKKVKQFGEELLDIIKTYCKEQGIEVSEDATEPEIEIEEIAKPAKINTKQVSFDMFKSGKSPEEIAVERNMAVSTIEGHLAHFLGTGDLTINQLISTEKLSLISDYFIKAESTLLGPAKETLGNDVSYGELRLVLKHLELEGLLKIKEGLDF